MRHARALVISHPHFRQRENGPIIATYGVVYLFWGKLLYLVRGYNHTFFFLTWLLRLFPTARES